MKIIRNVLLLLALLSTPAVAQTLPDNPWIVSNFAGLPVRTGNLSYPAAQVIYPSLVRDFTCTGGYQCIYIQWCSAEPFVPACNDQRIAFMHGTVNNQVPNAQYGSSILVDGNTTGWNSNMDVFLYDVALSPYWPAFTDYGHTNFDALTNNSGIPYGTAGGGHHYVGNSTVKCPVAVGQPAVPCWADAAFDIKSTQFQGVNLDIECDSSDCGINTFKFWRRGTENGQHGHYLVNTTVRNERYPTGDRPSGAADGGFIYTWYCDATINVYNSTFNGSPTIPPNMISCTDHTVGPIHINYLTVDPTTTGEMHPMFGGPGNVPPTIAAPASASVLQNQAAPVAGISISDTDAVLAGKWLTVTLSDTNGLLSATGPYVSGAGTKNLSIAGTLAQVNAALATLTDQESSTASDSIVINASDNHGGAAPTKTVAVAVDQVLAVIFPTGSIANGTDTWSFDQANSNAGNYAILKNGVSAAGGTGNYLLVHLGTTYVNTVGYGWWKWTGSAWVQVPGDPR